MEPIAAVARRWAVAWLSSHDPSICKDILDDRYQLHIGGLTLKGRDDYVTATVGQLELFPGLAVTVHELICTTEQVAIRFTEHGASSRHEGRLAAWGGVALHRWDGRRLVESYAEEDYLSRKRQLDSGRCDPIEPPAVAPWDTVAAPPQVEAEDLVAAWVQQGRLTGHPGVLTDDEWLGRPVSPLLHVQATEVQALFSAGDRVAFHAVQHGPYVGAESSADPGVGLTVPLHVAGIVTVGDGKVQSGRVVRDRLAMQRALQRQQR